MQSPFLWMTSVPSSAASLTSSLLAVPILIKSPSWKTESFSTMRAILRKRDGTLEGVSVIFQDVNTVMSSEVSIRRTLTTKENQAVYSFDHILGNSPCMTQALRLALRYSKVDETVLIQGRRV